MSCVTSIPKRVYKERQTEEGASLLERRRKFQSLRGVGKQTETWALISRLIRVARIRVIF